VERLATGFGFTEGLLWHPDGFLYFVDLRRSHLLRWQSGKGVEVVRENTDEGNSLIFDPSTDKDAWPCSKAATAG
jgi:gluconolactonase